MPRPNAYKVKGSFGEFHGSKVYYHGFPKRPSFLPKSGRGFGGLKYLLQKLKSKFRKFSLTFTLEEDSIKKHKSQFISDGHRVLLQPLRAIASH